MASLDFDSTTVQASEDKFGVIPANKYIAQIVDSDLEDNKAGTGQILKLQYQILDGEFTNRVIFQNLNIKNANDTAQRIAQENLSAICKATGVARLSDSSQVHNIPMTVRVAIQKDKTGQYEDRNEVKAWEAISGATQSAPAQQQSAPAATTTAAPAAGRKPWQKS